MRTIARLRLLALIAIVLCSQPMPAFGWSNGRTSPNNFGTHDWILYEANRLAAADGYTWLDYWKAQPVTDDPDSVYKDWSHHAYDVWGAKYGDAPTRVATLYVRAVAQLKAGDRANASRTFGVMSHYYADACNPLHTDESAAEKKMHTTYENAAQRYTDKAGENRAWVKPDGLRRVTSPAASARSAAAYAHRFYPSLVSHYNSSRYDSTVGAITRSTLNRSVNDLADLIVSAHVDAGLSNPVVDPSTDTSLTLYAAAVTASVSDAAPAMYTDVFVWARITDGLGKPYKGAAVTFVWRFESGAQYVSAVSDELGNATSLQHIGAAPSGREVVVEVTAIGGGQTIATTARFTPR